MLSKANGWISLRQLGERQPKLIVCSHCGSKILKPTSALTQESLEIPDCNGITAFDCVWKLNDMMGFENIGFTKPVEGLCQRYLSCADCDIGPIGYERDGSFNLIANRVGYIVE